MVPALVVSLDAGCGSPKAHARHHPRTAPSSTTTIPGISTGQIVVGTHQPVTGWDAPGIDEVAPATAAFFAYVDARGGVYGRSIVDKVEDDASDPGQAGDVVRQLILDDNVFAVLNGAGNATHAAVEAFLNAEHVPDLFAGSGCTCWNNQGSNPQFPWTSGWQPDYTVEGKLLGQYVATYAKTHSASGKVAYVFQNDTMGQQGVSGLDQELDPTSVVARQAFQSPTGTLADAAALVAQLGSSSAGIVVVFADPELTALTLLAAANASYHPQFVVSSSGADLDTLTTLLESYGAGGRDVYGPGASPHAIEDGLVSDAYLPEPGDASDPWIVLFRRIHDVYIPNLPFDGYTVYGMAVGYAFYALMESAGANPTRAKVIEALQSANLNGPNLAPYGYSATSHQGMTGGEIVIDSGGVMTATGPVEVTGDSGGIGTFSGAQTPPPAPLG